MTDTIEALVRSLGLPFLGSRDHISIEGTLNVPEFVGRIHAVVEERIEGFKARIAEVERMNRALLDRQDEVSRESYDRGYVAGVLEAQNRILAAVGEPKCEHGYTLSDLCQWVEDSANLPIDAEPPKEAS